VPVEDQQLAIALLMELAVQRGSLSTMLAAVRLLLTVTSGVDSDRDNRHSTVLTHAPLVPFLRRFQALALSSKAADGSDVIEVICSAVFCPHCKWTSPLLAWMIVPDNCRPENHSRLFPHSSVRHISQSEHFYIVTFNEMDGSTEQ